MIEKTKVITEDMVPIFDIEKVVIECGLHKFSPGLRIRDANIVTGKYCLRCIFDYVDEHIGNYAKSHREPIFKWLSINKHLIPQGDVLEFGCGENTFKDWFVFHKCNWQGLNKTDDKLELPKDITFGLIEDLKEEDKYDIIFGSHVFEHMENPLKVLRVIHKALKKGGRLVLATPLCVPEQIWEKSDYDHIFVLNMLQLKKLLHFAGFINIMAEETGQHPKRDSIMTMATK